MKTIIIDDEPKAIELLRGYITHFASIELIGTFRNGLKAFEFLTKTKVDLIFLDINMPHINGMSLSKMIDKESKIIFTTAYSEYAVESYEVGAVDYLLKPISLERFTKSVSKFLVDNRPNEIKTHAAQLVYIKSGSRIYRVEPNSINYIEKEGNYSIYYLDGQKIMARESVSEILENLPSHFYQVHKSFIVNKTKVVSVEKDSVMVDGRVIPIGASYKKSIFDILLKE
jgi:DNA-binding LytR/AlgR family response regulator